jgi:cystathionine beta-synthase
MRKNHEKPYDSVLDTIGWTPLIRLSRVTRGVRTPVLAKAEFFNPGGSVKDRIGLPIIEQAERDGTLKPGGVIVEATSGNTGIGLAMAAALRGYRCVFTMPDKMSQEKVRLLRAFGADVIVTPTAVPPDHPDHYLMTAKRIAQETPGAIFANQFYNDANPDAHYKTTGPEIWEQTEGRVTHFVYAAGTGGTLTGVGRYLKEKNKKIRVIHPRRDVAIEGPGQGRRCSLQSRRHRPGQDPRHARHDCGRRLHHGHGQRVVLDGPASHSRRRAVRWRLERSDHPRRRADRQATR